MSFQLNMESVDALVASVKDLPGKTFIGRHKNAGKPSRVVSLEVTAVASIPTKFGTAPYLVGTLVDDPKQAGRVVSMKLLNFDLKGAEVNPTSGFIPVDLSMYYVRTPEMASENFGKYDWLEKLADEDVEQAENEGMVKLSEYIVAGPKPKAKKTKKTAEVAA